MAGTGCYVFLFHQQIACWVALVGAVGFALMQMQQRYNGQDLTIKRLRRIIIFANVLFVVAALLMIDSCYRLLQPLFYDIADYHTWLYNKWIIALLVAAILQIYTTHRIDARLRKHGGERMAK